MGRLTFAVFQLIPTTYKVKVVLDHVVLESFSGQTSVAHASAEVVVGVLVPRGFDVVSLKHVIDEIAPAIVRTLGLNNSCSLCSATYDVNGSTCTEWKWFNGPEPFPRSGLVMMPAST